MTPIYAALITALAGVLVAVIGYFIGYRRLRYERLYEQRALVLAELFRLLSKVQSSAMSSVNPYQPLGNVRRLRLNEGKEAMTAAYHHFTASTLWLEPETNEKIREFLTEISTLLSLYEGDLDEQGKPGDEALLAAEHIATLVPEARQQLEAEFREILYPPPWYEKPLRWLEWVDAKLKPDKPA